MPGGGRGFTRVPSLVSIWSTAPFLLNNRLGTFYSDPSVATRMKGFDESIHQLLWPETRPHEDGFDGFIVRTTERSSIEIPKRSVPPQLKSLVVDDLSGPFAKLFDKNGTFKLGPIPKGFPINIAASYQPLVDVEPSGIGAAWASTSQSFELKVIENLPKSRSWPPTMPGCWPGAPRFASPC